MKRAGKALHTQDSKWLTVFNTDQPTDIRLICFSQAGAGPDLFCTWAQGLNDHIELLTFTLPTHGERQDEAGTATIQRVSDEHRGHCEQSE